MKAMYPKAPEWQEQKAVIEWANLNLEKYPELKWLFHVPNGEHREPQTGKRLKLMGTKRGVSDLLLLVPRNGFHGLCLEMKCLDGCLSDLSEDQKSFLAFEKSQGYAVCVGFGWENAVKKIVAYLNGGLK